METQLEKIRNELQKSRDQLTAIVSAISALAPSSFEVYTTVTLTDALAVTKGVGFPVFNSDDRMIYISNGATWVPISSVSLHNFAPTGATVNGWVSSPSTGTALGTAVLVVNTLYAMPFVVSQKRVIDQSAINVTAFAAGNIRWGLYRAGANGYPSTLIADFGAAVIGANGVKTLSAAPLPITLDPGLYFLALVSDNVSTIRGFAVATLLPVLGVSSALGTAWSFGWSVAFAYAALPTPFPAAAAVQTAAPLPAIFVRFSS